MKEYKFSPSPYVNISLRVTEDMVRDLKECWCKAYGSGKECEVCSWRNVRVFGIGMCELEEVVKGIIGEQEE